jgi:ApaG protein
MKYKIIINVKPQYMAHQSDPIKSSYLFSYHIVIKNLSSTTIKLVSRYWHITDGLGHSQDIHGPGVVGKTPIINSGNSFEYTSFCPLKTPMGFMEGSFRMVDNNEVGFDVEINRFRLLASQILN